MDESKCCGNCNFYRAHYAKDSDGKFYEINEGHCTHPHVKISVFRRGMKYSSACLCWRKREAENQEPSLNDIVKSMSTRIEQIAMHLKID